MFRFFTSDLRRNLIKILCLTVGLAVGFLLVAKIYFEETFDTSFQDAERLYRVTESVEQNGEYKEYDQTPGAIAPGLKRYVPQVEAATRSYPFMGSTRITLDDGRSFEVDGMSFTDSCYFDVFQVPIIAGNAHEALAVEKHCMIPRSLADKIGGNVIGMQFKCRDISDEYKGTIAGVYEDFPLNSSLSNNVKFSLNTLPLFMYDGRENWIGNDGYVSYAKLAKGTSPGDTKPHIRKMLEDNLDREAIDVVKFNIGMEPLLGLYTSQPGVKSMVWMLSLLAIIMLMCAGLNYLLIVISQMTTRAKEMAVRKCYGTSNAQLFLRVMGESVFFLVMSMGLALLLAFICSDLSYRLLGYTTRQLLSTGRVWMVEGAVCLGLLVITGVIPAISYCRTPVAHAFRTGIKSRRGWKLALLAIQFFASGVIMCLLMLVGRQYSYMTSFDMGYDYENIGYLNLAGVDKELRKTVVSELRRLGIVEGVASSDIVFTEWGSGNNVWLGNDYLRNANVADLYSSDPEIFEVMGIKLLQGGGFSELADSVTRQVVVEERFIDFLRLQFGVEWHDLIGKSFNITGHKPGPGGTQEFTVCGVVENMRRGGFENSTADLRPAVMFPSGEICDNLFIRFNHLTPEAVKEAQDVVNRLVPDREKYISPFKAQVDRLSESARRFGTSVMVVGIAIVIIALIGLIGYTADEVQRRAKEIAIRKVTGSAASHIVRLFCINILKIAVPSLIAGGAAAIIIGKDWLSQFTDRVSLSPLSMAVCLIFLLILILAVVTINCINIARSNPVNHLRNE